MIVCDSMTLSIDQQSFKPLFGPFYSLLEFRIDPVCEQRSKNFLIGNFVENLREEYLRSPPYIVNVFVCYSFPGSGLVAE